MLTIAVILISPTLMVLAARLFSRRRASSRALGFLEWAIDCVFLVALSLLVMTPLGRVTVNPWAIHPLSFAYGKLAAIFNMLVAPALGALQGRMNAYWVLESTPNDPQRRPRVTCKRVFVHFLGLLLLFSTCAYLWGMWRYPIVSIDQIVFHMHMPLQGTAPTFVSDLILNAIVPTALLFALYEFWAWATPRICRNAWSLSLRGVKWLRIDLIPVRLCAPATALLMVAWLFLLAPCLNLYLNIVPFFTTRMNPSTFIEEEYVEPAEKQIVFPEQKRNLISIYLESGETTFQDRENGGVAEVNYTPEMTKIARENISFSQSDLIAGAAVTPGAGWTIGGLVAETSGLPLKLYVSDAGVENSAGTFTTFLPRATTLGDLLKEQGYRNVFLCGSDFAFGGRDLYYAQHGEYEVWDMRYIKDWGLLPDDYYYHGWGVEDRTLYQLARQKLTELAAGGVPFHFSMITVDTHAPGFPCEDCPTDIDDPYLRIIACASRQLGAFIDWCGQQPFFDNTTIVIAGDHSSMADAVDLTGISVSEYNTHIGSADRLIYNVFINSLATPVQEKNRLFTTLDIFPSTLASIGVQIEGDRLALGTNLFSDRQTLAEEYGYEYLFEELYKLSHFYNEYLLFP